MIARFYALHEKNCEALLAAARPEIRWNDTAIFMFKKPIEKQIDHFPNFLSEYAVEPQEYHYSGYGFCDLDSLLKEKNGWTLFELGNSNLATKISEARATSIAVFNSDAAKAALARLNSTPLEESEVREYFQKHHPPEDEDPGTEAVLSAFKVSKTWLAAVGENEIGLLILE